MQNRIISQARLPHPLQGIMMDIDGVVWRGDTLLINQDTINKLILYIGVKFLFLSNNSTKTNEQYLQRFRSFGIHIEKQHVLTSSDATAQYLPGIIPPPGPIFVVGEEGLVLSLISAGYHISEDNPKAVVAGLDRYINYKKLETATLAIRKGATFIGTNPDRTFPIPEGLAPGAGAILASIEAATDVVPLIIGKPNKTMYDIALKRLDLQPNNVMMIGDRLDTDILGGQNAGLLTGLVLTGVSSYDEAVAWSPPPTIIAPSLDQLLGALLTGNHQP